MIPFQGWIRGVVGDIPIMSELYEFFRKLVEKEQLPAFLCGVLLTVTVFVPILIRVIRHWSLSGLVESLRQQVAKAEEKERRATSRLESERRKMEDEGQAHEARIGDLIKQLQGGEQVRKLQDEALKVQAGQAEVLRQQRDQLSADLELKATKSFEQDLKIKLEKRRTIEFRRLVKSYSKQLDGIDKTDGKIWEKPTSGPVAGVLPLGLRGTPIISLINLKGGVGKTTLTANLGVTLASQGLRVLLIDLDHQSSLTRLFLDYDQRLAIEKSGSFVDRFMAGGGDLAEFRRAVLPVRPEIGPGRLLLAPVHEDFVDVENKVQVRWQAGLLGEDARFRLRAALHSPDLRHHYDVVLIDCPPRWSTGSINALAASDYVLIPVLLERTSAEAVPRILSWIRKFRNDCHPGLNLLGVVGNKASAGAKLIARENAIWTDLHDLCVDAWDGPVRLFDEVIREHPSPNGPFAALDPRYQSRYEHLIDLIRKEIPHAHLKPATVPPLAGSPAGGGGH